MAKNRKKKNKARSTDFVKNANYSVKGSGNNPTKKNVMSESEETAVSKKSLANARKMAKIEAYAKKHGITVTQAMVHFMN